VYHRLEIIGRENLPTEGSFVMVANHCSHIDALCLLAALPLRKLHRAYPAAASDYFFTSAPRMAIATILINALPFRRTSHIRESLDLCRRLLENPGNILIIFPEGTRSPTGELGEFKPGVGSLLAGTKIPLVPCYIAGAFAAWPKQRTLPRPRHLRLMIGLPRTFESLRSGRLSAERITADMRQAIMELKGTCAGPRRPG
jgi:1-acyl-sn-glycerol-3-phosphate acyltransferase